jgi:hypothetical protein
MAKILANDGPCKGGCFMRFNSVLFASLAASILASVVVLASFPAQSQTFQYAVPPEGDLVYRIDKANGTMEACRYGTNDCAGPGQGAGPHPPGKYRLVIKDGGNVSWEEEETGAHGLCRRMGGMVCCCPGNQPPSCTQC